MKFFKSYIAACQRKTTYFSLPKYILVMGLVLGSLCGSYAQSAESCPDDPNPDGTHPCPEGIVPHYTIDLSDEARGNASAQVEGASGSACCGDELNANAKCNVVEILLNEEAVGININFYGNLGNSGSVKVSQDATNVCNGGIESLNTFDRDSICLTNDLGTIFITVCKPGTADYCIDIESYSADGFGDQVVLLDDVVNCQYEVNVSSTDVLNNIVWTSLTGDLNDTILLSCPSGQLDCLTPTFSPPGDLDSDEEYEFQVCGEYIDENCGNVGIVVCDTVIIEVLPQIIVELEDVIVCEGALPYEIEADVDPEEPTFQYHWYNDHDGPLGPGTLIEITDDPYHEATEAGLYSIYVVDTDDSYACERTFTFNFEIVEEFEPIAVPELISFDECNLTVMVTGENSLDNTGSDNLIYEWDFGDGGAGFFESGSYTYADCDAYTITLTVIDPDIIGDCEIHSADTTFQFDDTVPILTCPTVISGQCDISDVPIYENWAEFIAAGGSGFQDNCTVDPSSFTFLSETDNNDPDGLPCPMDWTRIYYIQDMCGNFTTCEQTVQIWDLTPPVIDPEAQDYIIICDVSEIASELQFWLDDHASADATDNCTDQGDLVWTYEPANPTLSDECGETGDVEVTFYVSDECGNSSSTVATFSVTDNDPPSVSNCDLSSLNITTDCQGAALNEAFAIQWNSENIAYLNTCVEELCGSFTIDDNFTYNLVNSTCENVGEITVQYTISDGCDNFIPVTATLTFEDDTPPMIVDPPMDLTVECDLADQEDLIQDWLDIQGGAIADETCSGVRWEHDYSGIDYDCGGTGTALVTFIATDSCGNSSPTAGNIIISDNTSPVVSCDPSNPVEECDGIDNNESTASDWNDASIAALELCSTDPCGSFTVTSDYDFANYIAGCGEAGSLTVNFFVRDECGNITPKVGIITFVDNTEPEITCTPEDVTVECVGSVNQENADEWNAENIALLQGCSSDICGTITVNSDYDFANLIPTCGSGGTLEVTYTVADQCNFELEFTATLTIEDTRDPEIVCPDNITLDCPADIDPTNTGVATATDDCDSDPAITYSDVVIPGCGNTYEIERTWLATDECDNTDNCVQIITVRDITPPMIDMPAEDLTIECNLADQDALIQAWLADQGGAEASDACNIFDWDNDFQPLAIDCGGAGSALVTFTVEDACGNTNTTAATVTVIDNTSPVVSCDPSNPVEECDGIDNNESTASDWNDASIAALELCSTDPCGSFTVTSDYDFANYIAGCGEAGSLTVNFFVRDECGNITPKVGIITFVDNTEPEITCTPEDVTVECVGPVNQENADEWNADNIALLQGCSSDICGTITVNSDYDFANLISTCGSGGTLEVTYTVADQCNFELEFTATLTIEDTRDPEIICPDNVTLDCPADIDPTNTGVATATDDCDSDPAITYSDVVIPGCGNTYEIERTWLATDECDNTDNCVQIITVQDITPPMIDMPAEDLTIECNLADQDALIQAWLADQGGAQASDACNIFDWDNDFQPLAIDCGGAGSALVTFTVEDACGNTNTTAATVTVIDNTSPVVSCDPSNPVEECDGIDNNESTASDWNDASIAALELCSTDPCGSFTVTSDYDFANYIAGCGEAGSLTVNFFVRDECGNITPKVGIITFVDNTEPEITCTPEDVTVECVGPVNQENADEWNADNIALLQGCSSDICGTITVNSDYDFANLIPTCGSGGTLEVTYTVADQCSFELEFTATLTIEDTRDPEIVCPDNITLDCPADIDPTNTGVATATDDCDSDPAITYSDVVIPGCGNTYEIERTWLATDECDNTSNCVQIITVQDITPPMIDMPAEDLTIECNLADQDALIQAWLADQGGAEASDACNIFDWDNDFQPLAIDCGGAGSALVTFTVEDACGNTNTTAATVTVIDNTSPVVSCDPSNPVEECDGIDNNESTASDWNDASIAALELCSTDPCGSFTVTSDYDFANYIAGCGEAGSLTVNFFVRDECGNITPKVGIITFVDNTEPEITCTPEDVTVECVGSVNQENADEWNADNIALLQGCSSDICGTITVNSDYDFANLIPTCGSGGTLEVTYTVADQCNFELEFTATLTIEDTRDPEIICPDNVTLDCPADTDPTITGVATATDDCDSDPAITYSDVVIPGCGNTYEIERTWLATDECDNTSNCVQIITVQDITAPTIMCPENVTISFDGSCGLETTPTDLGTPTVSDFCDDNPQVRFEDDLSDLDGCNGSGFFTRTWIVEDACGNVESCDQVIFVVDDSNPIVTCPADVTVYYDDDCALELDPSILGNPTVSDNCDTDPAITYVDDLSNLNQCNSTGYIIRTFSITDACLNVTSCEQRIDVIDNIAPTITCPDEVTIFYSSTCELDLVPQFDDYPTIEDNCDVDPGISYSDDLTGLDGCNSTGTVVRTWTVTDACGNSSSCLQTLIIQDDTAPIINCPPEVTIFFSFDCQLNVVPDFTGEPTISDNCDASPIVNFEDDISPLTECNGTGTFSRTWTVEDVCGNTSECIQSIVVQDNTNPTVECPVDVTLFYDDVCSLELDPSETGSPVVTDNCDADPIVSYEDDDSGLTECNNTGIIVRRWSIIDACDNETICIQNITVIDNIGPSIECPEDITIDCPGDIDPANTGSPQVSDNCGFEDFTYSDEVEEICPGNSIITRTWTLMDNCGLTATCIQTITIQDDTAPELTCPEDITLECDGNGNVVEIQEWLETFSATDNCSLVEIDNDYAGVSGNCEGIGETTVIFAAIDECGNAAICSATLTIVDTTPPTADDLVDITLDYLEDIPNIDVEIVIGEQDLCDPNPIVTWVSETDNGATGCFGDPLIINRIYNIADCSGNNVDRERIITVETPELIVDFETNEIFCTGDNTGTIDLTVSGGTAPYDLDWDDDTYDGLTNLDGLYEGTYEVTVYDANGCSQEVSIEVLESENALNIELGPENPLICIDGEITLNVQANGGTPPYLYAWNDPSSTDENLLVETEGTYEVTVTDQNGCVDIASIYVNVLENPEIDNPGPQVECDVYILPDITGTDLSGNVAYFSQQGGQGTKYDPGDEIRTSGTIYIFDETGTIPNCTTETDFEITIIETPNPSAGPDIINCDQYTLPQIMGDRLSGNESYFTESNGTGDQYFAGDIITSDITLYAYDQLNGCPAEDILEISIVETPELEQPQDVTVCGGYVLPEIDGLNVTADAAYYTASNQGGTKYLPGDIITEYTQLYIFTSAGDCFDEVRFDVDIVATPIIYPISSETSCDAFVLGTIFGENLSGNQTYFDEPDGQGNEYRPGDEIAETITLYAYDLVLECIAEIEFEIEIVETPLIDPADDVTVCDSYTLPEIFGIGVANAHYYTESGGQGTQFQEGDEVNTSGTIYMYVSAGSCVDEQSIEVTIIPSPLFDAFPDVTSCDVFVLEELTGQNLSGNEAYFTEKSGEGDKYESGDTIKETTTLFIYDVVMDCDDEFEFVVEIVETPEIDPMDDVTVCDIFVLPEITGIGVNSAFYYTEPDGGGTRYDEGDEITESIILFLYIKAGACEAEESFNINVIKTPDIDPQNGITGCDAVVLPTITGSNLTGNEAYYTQPNGLGDKYEVGANIDSDLTLYIFDANGDCLDEEMFEVQIVSTPDIDPLDDVTVCDAYTLPEISGIGILGASYYTEAGGQGTQLNAGDVISQSSTLYIHVSAGTCGDEEVFDVSVLETPDITPVDDIVACDEVVLPVIDGDKLSGNQAYFTAPQGTGDEYNAGDVITSDLTLYIYDIQGECSDEEMFTIEIVSTPDIDPIADVVICDEYILPEITGVGTSGASYFTQTQGQGDEFEVGDTMRQSMIIYVFMQAGSCEDEESFSIQILPTPDIDPLADISTCDSYILDQISGTNLSGDVAYYTEANGSGNRIDPGTEIFQDVTLYLYESNGECADQEVFNIEIIETPAIDPIANIIACDSFALPVITGVGISNANYFSQPDGQGIQYEIGDMITANATIYMYINAGGCLDQESFEIEVLSTPDIDPQEDVSACDAYILTAITGANLSGNEAYYSASQGQGTKYNEGDEINSDMTIYIYDGQGACFDEESFNVAIIETPNFNLIPNESVCNFYILPELTGTGITGASYFSESQGNGSVFEPGDTIFSSTDMYAFVGSDDCSHEIIFSIEILVTPIIENPADQFVCEQYILETINGTNLTGQESYWTGPAKTGDQLTVGDAIEPGTIIYIYDGNDLCNNQVSFEVIGQDVPRAFLSGGGIICEGIDEFQTLQIDFENGNNWIVEILKDGVLLESVETTINPFVLDVTESGDYTLGAVSNASGCSSESEGSATVNVFKTPLVDNFTAECNSLEPGYLVSFEISGGDPFNYFVNGELIDNPTGIEPYIFTQKMDSEVPYSFEVTDINGCATYLFEDEGLDCGCITRVGQMDQTLIEICGDQGSGTGIYDLTNQVFDFDDTLMFVLHEGTDTSLVNIIALSFDSEFFFDGNTMNYGQTYYISAVVGNKLLTGFVDLDDECLAVAIGQPIVFYDLPTASISGDFKICAGEEVQIEVILEGEAPWSVAIDVNGESLIFDDINSSPYLLTIAGTEDLTLSLISVNDNHCEGEVSGIANVLVDQPINVETIEAVEICNVDFKGSVIDLDTLISSGSTEGTWEDLSNSGAIFNGNLVDFNGVEAGEYQFQYTLDSDEGICASNSNIVLITVLECSCPIINIGEAGPFCNDDAVFDLSSIENDSDEGSWSIINTPQGQNPAILTDDIFNGNNADAGIYELLYSINLNDPLCVTDTTIMITLSQKLTSGVALPTLEFCDGSTETINLFDLLSAYDEGGSWNLDSAPQGNAFDSGNGTFNLDGISPGTYTFTYSIDSESPCPDEATTVEIKVNETPLVIAGSGFMLTCEMQSGKLSAEVPTTGNYDIIWSSPQGNIASGENTLTPLVDQPGIYYVEVRDQGSGCGSIDSVEVLIDAGFPNADAGPDLLINCASVEVVIDATNSSDGDYVYMWIGPDGNEIETFDNKFLLKADVPGQYIFIIIDQASNCSNTDTVMVDGQLNYPLAEIAQPDILSCENLTVLIDASESSNNSNIQYLWTSAGTGNIVGSSASNIIEVDEAGLYILEVLDTVNFCVTYDTIQVTIDRELPQAEAGMSSALDCETTELLLNGSGSSQGQEFAYSWLSDQGNIVSGANTLNPLINAPAVYYLQVNNTRNGCSTIDSVEISDDVVPIEAFDFEQINPCFGDNEGLIAVTSVEGGVGPFTYALNGNSFGDSPTWENLSAGTYTVSVKGSNACTITENITIFEGLELDVDAGEDQRISLGDTAHLAAEINISEDLIESLVWEPLDDKISCVECLETSVWPYETTLYTTTLTDVFGCTEFATVRVYVDRRSKIYAPNIFTPNGDGDNDYFTIFTGTEIDRILELKIFSRWGELMFKNSNFEPGSLESGWDGTFRSMPVDAGVFAWYARVRLIDGTERKIKGDVTVIK